MSPRNKFEGYMSARETKRFRQAQELAEQERRRNRSLHASEKIKQVYRVGLPLLIEHAMDVSKPVLVPRFLGPDKLHAGWIISEFTSPAGQVSWSNANQDAGRHASVLTEAGIIGPANFIDRGVETLRMWHDVNKHFEKVNSPVTIPNSGPMPWERLQKNIEGILHQAGVEIDLNVK